MTGAPIKIPPDRRALGPGFSTLFFYVLVVVELAWFPPIAAQPHGFAELGALIVTTVVVLILSTMVHEGAHVVAGTLLGMRAFEVYIGRGAAISSVRVGATMVVFQSLPVTGRSVIATERMDSIRVRLAGMYLAAPLMNLVVAIAAGFTLDGAARVVIAGVNGLMALTNLVPVPIGRAVGVAAGAGRGTDGYQALRLFFAPRTSVEGMAATYVLREFWRLRQNGKSAAALDWLVRAQERMPGARNVSYSLAEQYLLADRFEEAWALLRDLYLGPEARTWPSAGIPAGVRAVMFNNVAWCAAMVGGVEAVAAAQTASAAALSMAPQHGFIHGTRAAALLVAGDLDGASFELDAADTDVRSSQAHRGQRAALRVRIALRRGNVDLARELIAVAETLAPERRLVREVSAEVAAEVLGTAES